MLTRKIFATVLLLICLASGLAGLGVQSELAHHFGHEFRDKQASLPLLTGVSLMVLGDPGPDGNDHPLHWCFVIFFFAVPILLMVAAWRAKDRLTLLEIIVFGGGLYMLAVIATLAGVGFGLSMPYLNL